VGSRSPRLTPPHEIVAGLDRAAADREAGDYQAARQQLLPLVRRTAPNEPLRAAVLNQLGILAKAMGEYRDAKRYYLTALPIVRRYPRNRYVELADLYHNLGGLAHACGDHASGEPFARRAVRLRTRRHGAQAIVTWLDRTAHAALLDGLGQFDRSEGVYRAALPILRRHFGPRHYEIALTLNNLGCACAAQAKHTEALGYLRQSLVLKQRLYGPRHVEAAIARNNLALSLADAGEVTEARRLLRVALRAFIRLLGPRHPTTRACRRTLSRL
jgi:tetratricopeptide (TPR) repeat protein